MKDSKERKNFIVRTTFRKYLVPMRNCLKSTPQRLNFVMGKATSKRYTLD